MPYYEPLENKLQFSDKTYETNDQKVIGFKPKTNVITAEDLDSFRVPTHNNSCRLYNRDKNVRLNIEKKRNKVSSKRCPYTNITHCDPSKNHKCFICASHHSGLFCSFSNINTLSRDLIITSNSNGTFKNLGQFFFDSFENHKNNFIGKSGATIQKIHQNLKERPDTRNKINLLYNPNFIDIARNPNDIEHHFSELVHLLNTCLSLNQIPILIFVPLTHTTVSHKLNNSLKHKVIKNNRDLEAINKTMKELNDRLVNLKTYDGKNIVHRYFCNFPKNFLFVCQQSTFKHNRLSSYF